MNGTSICSKVNDATIESLYSWLVVILSLVIASLSFGAVTAVPILMQPMAADLGWSRSILGLAHALAMASAGTVGFAIGYLADRSSFALISIMAGTAISLGLWTSSLATDPWHLFLPYALLVGALGQGTFFGPITANISRWFDNNRAFAMAIVMCGQSVGGLTVPVALRTLAEVWGWRDAMAAYGLVCLVGIVCCSLVFLRTPPQEAATEIPPQLGVARAPGNSEVGTFAVVSSALVFLNTGSFMLIAHLVAYGEEQGLQPALSAGLLSTLLGATLVSRLLGGFLLDRMNPQGVLVVCTLMLPVGTLTLVLGASVVSLMLLGAILFGLGYGGVFPAFTHIVRSTFPSTQAGTWISAMFLFGFLAAAIGSWLGGFLRDQSGSYELSLLAAFALTVASLGITSASALKGRGSIEV